MRIFVWHDILYTETEYFFCKRLHCAQTGSVYFRISIPLIFIDYKYMLDIFTLSMYVLYHGHYEIMNKVTIMP